MLNAFWRMRLKFWVNRFHGLQRASLELGGVPSPCWAERKLFRKRFALDLSRSTTHKLLYLEGERFVDERYLIQGLLRPGMTVVDVGANIGYYLLMFQQVVGVDGFVICIEPSEENLLELEKNIRLNRFENVILHKVAVGMMEGNTGLRSGINSGVVKEGQGDYLVPMRRLDFLIERKVDFLKIDVEGFEGQVIQGAREVIRRDRPTIFLELHPRIVSGYGFSVRTILEDLKNIYSQIELYDIPRPDDESLIRKISVRYFRKNPIRRIDNVEDFLEHCGVGETERTFWAVCRPSVDIQ